MVVVTSPMDTRSKRYRIANWVMITLIVVFSVIGAVFAIQKGDMVDLALCAVSIVIPLVPPLFYKLFHLTPVADLSFLVYVFCFFALTLGCGFSGMDAIPYYDKVLHFVSGILGAFAGFLLFVRLKHNHQVEKDKDIGLMLVFCNGVNMLIAVVWEIYEFLTFVILHVDSQKMLTTGTFDTMGDVITCLVGGILLSVLLYRYHKLGKPTFLMRVYEHYYQLNHKEK